MLRMAVVLLLAGAALMVPGYVAAGTEVAVVSWQLVPYCNVVTLAAELTGTGATLTGADDNCGAAKSAAFGTVATNPAGTLALGLTIVTPGGPADHVDVVLDAITLSGTWQDSSGHAGTFQFTPALPASGSPRPAPTLFIPPQSYLGAFAVGGGTLTLYVSPSGGGSTAQELDAQALMPRACVAQGFQVSTTPSLASGSVAVTLRVNLGDTLTCTVTAGGSSCNTGTATQTIGQGALVDVRAVFTSLPSTTRAHYGFVCS